MKLKGSYAAALALLVCAACDRPTSGARIPVYERPQVALVVIGGKVPAPDGDPMLAATNRLIDNARPLGVELVYLRGATGAAGDPRVRAANDQVFASARGDAFSNPELDRFFRSRAVDHLVLTGLAGEPSIELTGQGALNRGYKVMVVSDAVAATSVARRDRALESLRQAGAELIASERVLAEWARRKRYLGSR